MYIKYNDTKSALNAWKGCNVTIAVSKDEVDKLQAVPDDTIWGIERKEDYDGETLRTTLAKATLVNKEHMEDFLVWNFRIIFVDAPLSTIEESNESILVNYSD